ncbi:Peroxidase 12 [Bienertia sinuspersici]
MDQFFANNLKLTCPTSNTTNTTNLDLRTPNTFDNKYYVDLMNRQGLFTTDQDFTRIQELEALSQALPQIKHCFSTSLLMA